LARDHWRASAALSADRCWAATAFTAAFSSRSAALGRLSPFASAAARGAIAAAPSASGVSFRRLRSAAPVSVVRAAAVSLDVVTTLSLGGAVGFVADFAAGLALDVFAGLVFGRVGAAFLVFFAVLAMVLLLQLRCRPRFLVFVWVT
jgi:hypothetical protein